MTRRILRTRAFAALLFFIATAFSPLALALPTIERFTTANGVRVDFVASREQPLIDVVVSFDAGSARDPEGKEGLASLTRQLLDTSTRVHDEQGLSDAFADLAVSLSGSVDEDRAGKFPRERTRRPSGRRSGGGVDQIGHGLRLCQVDLAGKKGALGKLAGTGEPRAQPEAALEQKLQHHRPAVPVQLQHVFAGKRMRRREEERQPLVDHRPMGVVKACERGHPRRRHPPEQRLDECCERRSRDPHHADAAAPRRSGNRRDHLARRLPFLHPAHATHPPVPGSATIRWRNRSFARPFTFLPWPAPSGA